MLPEIVSATCESREEIVVVVVVVVVNVLVCCWSCDYERVNHNFLLAP